MKLSREEVLHIALLARVGVSEKDVEKFSEQLSNILENFEVLQQVDTTDVPPTAQPFALQNVTAADEPAPSMDTERVLSNAPRREGDLFRVRPVLE